MARCLNETGIGDDSYQYKDGYKKLPIIDFIAFDHVIIDLLHLWLRMSNNILDEFMKELEVADGGKWTKKSEDFHKNKNLWMIKPRFVCLQTIKTFLS